tara:strand:- start:2840 stop:3067 length:228 start_codon:yes stop_codon:yes gene_type:complete
MLIFTFTTSKEKLDIMLSDDLDYIRDTLNKIKRDRIKFLLKIENHVGILEIDDHIKKLINARLNPKPKIMKKSKR